MSTFISYAQNFEDVMLRRALADVSEGFYVDVGAQHPLRDSVTRAFYERGWRGINIEPVLAWHGLLEVDRPEDVNLQMAVGASTGDVEFFEVDDSGLSTTSVKVAAGHARDGRAVRVISVPQKTLDTVLEQYGRQPIHFLKIDVEGSEAEVLRGLSLSRWRPWIIVVEATSPNTQADASYEWSPLLESAGYRRVYHDGLNAFFLAVEQEARAVHFVYPPNHFDNFVRHSDWERGERARRLEAELGQVRQTQQQMSDFAATLDAEVRDARVQLQSSRRELEEVAQRQAELERLLKEREQDLVRARANAQQVQMELEHHRHDAEVREAVWAVERERQDAELRRRRAEADAHAAQLTALEARFQAVFASRSWRLTQPLRWVTERLGLHRDLPPLGPQCALPAGPDRATELSHNGAVPGEARLLQLASAPRGPMPVLSAGGSAPAAAPTVSVGPSIARLGELLAELDRLAAPPSRLPPRLARLPGSTLVRRPVTFLYERLFRRQAYINAKLVEAIRLLRAGDRRV